MALFTLDDARTLRKSRLENVEEQAQRIAEDLRTQSSTLEEVLANIRHRIQSHPQLDTFVVGILTRPIVDVGAVARIGPEKILPTLEKLLEEKYREAFPDFKVEQDLHENFVFYLRVTF
jgi:hypothetical protein